MSASVHRLFDDPPVSRRSSSASIASRMNAAMRFGPTRASMRCLCSSVSRTFVSLTLSGGRPMRGGVTVPEKFVKVIEKPSPLIDMLSVPGYISGDGYKINRGRQVNTDRSHLIALISRLGNEKAYLRAAKTDGEKSLRQVWISQIEAEIAAEERFIGMAAQPDVSDDELLAELMA